MNNFNYIKSESDLIDLINLIKQKKIIALDTEFHRETTYYPILSLIQIAVDEQVFLIDCLQGLDLSGVFAIIADEKILKIFHSCTQDLQIFYHYSGLLPKNIADTQIMGNFCEFGFNLGYSEIVEKLFEKKLDKKQQRSDWRRRPLSAKQLEYAALDVVYLQKIYEIFLEKLIAKKRVDWLREEILTMIQKTLFRSDLSIYKSFSAKNKTAVEMSQIRLLALLREKWAQKINIPKRHLIKDEEIEKIVKDGFCNLDLKNEILDEIAKILNYKEIVIKALPSNYMDEKQKLLFAKAKNLTAKIAQKEKLKDQFLLTSFDLKNIICHPNSIDEVLQGWRRELLLTELQKL